MKLVKMKEKNTQQKITMTLGQADNLATAFVLAGQTYPSADPAWVKKYVLEKILKTNN